MGVTIDTEPPRLVDDEEEELVEIESDDDEMKELVEIESDDDEMEEVMSEASGSVKRVHEDAEEMEISDDEMESLHQNLGTVYFSDLFRKEDPSSCLKALILTPTRELTLQAYQHLRAIGAHTNIRVVPVVGGMAVQKQMRLLSYNPEVVVATPGRFLDLYKKDIPHLRDLSQLKFFVIDECDKMIRHGDFKDLTVLLQCIPEYARVEETYDAKTQKGRKKKEEPALPAFRIPAEDRQMQTLLFSATLTLPRSLHRKLRPSKKIQPGEDVDEMALALDQLRFRGEPVVIDLTSKAKMADKVQEAYILCPEEKIDAILYSIIMKYPGRTLVFCNAIKSVRRLTETLRLMNITAQPIHAAKQQSQRLKALERFVKDENAVLVATDVAARGLDIPDVRCVVHYNVPRAADLYIHRSGRTARVEADGLALSLVVPSEILRFQALFRALGRSMPPMFPLDQSPLQECAHRMKLAKKVCGIDMKLSLAKKDAAWTQRTAETLQMDVSRPISSDEEDGAQEELKEEREHLHTALARRLATPLDKKLHSKYVTGDVLPDVKGMDSETKKKASSAFKETLHKAHKLNEIQLQNRAKKRPFHSQTTEDRIQRHHTKLNEILSKNIDKNHKLKSLSYTKQKLVVIPPALGREVQGADAMQVMKNYMKTKQRSMSSSLS